MSQRIGILGFAHGHVHAYCSQWRQHFAHDVQVVAGWDHDAARLDKKAAEHGIEACASPDDVLAKVDAVVIAAETSLHAELVEQAAAAGKTIVLQKPMALTLGEADRMVAAVERHGVPFTMAWQMRVDPQNVEIKRLIESGVVGRVVMVRRRHGLATQYMFDGKFGQSWHASPKFNRGMWADDASHAIDFLLWLLGEPLSVMAEIDTLVDPTVPDDQGIAIYRYADGKFAEVVSSFTCAAGENTTEIVGERGTIIQNYGDAPSCNIARPEGGIALKWYTRADGKWTISDLPAPANHGERIANLAGPLAEFVCGKRGPIATVDEGRTALRMTLACYQSAAEGRRINMNEVTYG